MFLIVVTRAKQQNRKIYKPILLWDFTMNQYENKQKPSTSDKKGTLVDKLLDIVVFAMGSPITPDPEYLDYDGEYRPTQAKTEERMRGNQ